MVYMPEVSLIIAVHKRQDFLEKIFASLDNQSLKDFEVLIAEDGIDEGVAKVLERYRTAFMHPLVHVRQEHAGFRKALIANKAVASAKSGYLIFIDGDCILHHRFLERHYAHRRLQTILSGRRVSLDEYLTQRISLEDVKSRRIEHPRFWFNHCLKKELKHGIYVPLSFEIENYFLANYTIVGCNFSVHTIDFYKINGYDERIVGRGMEDSNLYERVRVKGFRVCSIAREALQYHLFHTFDPIPHSTETIRAFCTPKDPWTEFGLIKGRRE